MADISSRVKNTLDELRMFILGDQILLGFETRAVFEPGFAKLPRSAQVLELVALALQTLVLACVLFPSARHRLVDGGKPSPGFERSSRWTAAVVLALFAAALGIDVKIATMRIYDGWATTAGIAIAVAAFVAWFGIEFVMRRRVHVEEGMESVIKTSLKDRISHVLTECRVALPGAQALLGFQLITVLMDRFEKLPFEAKAVHLASMLAVGLATVLLIMPAAFHRLVERGQETERFHKFASASLMLALVPLGAGVAGELVVVVFEVTRKWSSAITCGLVALVVFAFFWFGLPMLIRLWRRGGEGDDRLGRALPPRPTEA